MRNQLSRMGCLVTLVSIAGVPALHAQTASDQAAAVQQSLTPAVLTPVPRVIWFSGAFTPADKRPVASAETVTVSVYREREGGDAVWQETQTVNMETDGRYSLLMGSTLGDGMPLDVFTSGEPRWIGITVNRPGETEQPRVHLASVPYALKAADTDTLGGKPASAFVLADQKTPHGSKSSTDAESPLTAGTPGYLGMFVDNANLGNSALYQNTGRIGLGTMTPLDVFDVQFTNSDGGATGYAVQNLSSSVNAYSGMLFYDQNGALGQFQGFNNSTHEYRINNIASGGSINFMIGTSKFLIANSGNIGIGVAAPAAKLDVAGDVNLTTTLKVRGVSMLLATPNYTSMGLGRGALEAPAPGNFNTANGYFALADTIGEQNTGMGAFALTSTTLGTGNTAVGYIAMSDNVDGAGNTAVGLAALGTTTTGSGNIAIGFAAGTALSSDSSNNILIASSGGTADNNTIRLGTPATHTRSFMAGVRDVSTGGNDGAAVVIDGDGQLGTASSPGANVGIGTNAPKAKLHVAGGPIYIAQPNSLIITSPNGNCWFITVNNAGALSSIPVTCPQ